MASAITIAKLSDGMAVEPGSSKVLEPSIDEILSCIADAVVCTGADGKVLFFNSAAELIFGYSASEVLGSDIHVLIPSRFREHHRSHLSKFSAAPMDVARTMAKERKVFGVRRDGTEFPAEAMLSCRHFGSSTLLTVIIRDVSQRIELEEQRAMILSEMAHRFRNIMAMVDSVVGLTANSVSTVAEFQEVLRGRLRSILRNQEALVEPSRQVELVDLIEFELGPFRSDDGHRIHMDGPPVTVPASQTINVSLVLHELTTNAVKYGALSQPEGRVSVTWKTAKNATGDVLHLDWVETGGPIVTPPTHSGFGSKLIERSFGPSSAKILYPPEGLVGHFEVEF